MFTGYTFRNDADVTLRMHLTSPTEVEIGPSDASDSMLQVILNDYPNHVIMYVEADKVEVGEF